MEPNETLERIRAIRLLMAVYGSEDTSGNYRELASELAETVQSLDEWLSNGGFLPQDWSTRFDRSAT